ncbi:MAG: NUDIX domain-containing protein [Anaerolineae bacterium]|jgi:ADP-ribose pyrophosphatase YjhB (NUDIX family)|nr:NUDIX domain-containing protein [Anaerolineae bacterium]
MFIDIASRRFIRRAFGLMIRYSSQGRCQLLTLTYPEAEGLRFPGGTVESGEAPIECVYRGIERESTITRADLTLVRTLGVTRYFKESQRANIERHDFLLTVTKAMPDQWEHAIDTRDGQMILTYRWIEVSEISQINREFSTHVTDQHLPEIFTQVR